MLFVNDLPKKRRQFSQDEISIHCIPPKHQDSLPVQSLQRFKKLNCRKSHTRKSMDLEKISKCELNSDAMGRQTDWNKTQIDTIEFQKIIEKRKHQNRFKFKTIQIQSIQHNRNNSLESPYEIERIKSVVDFQIKQQQNFSLHKESVQFHALEKELKDLNDRKVEEMTKNKVLTQLVALLSYEISKSDEKQVQKERSLSVVQKYSQAIRKQQQKMDFFIRQSNDIKQKIINSKKEIFVYRSERVVYSSLFKQLQQQIKLSQNLYNRILINSMSFFQSFCLSQLNSGRVQRSFQAEKTQAMLQSYNDCNNFFSSMQGTNGVKFLGTLNFNEEELLNDKINNNNAINYYINSRKVIVLPRYKQHYQLSMKKINIESETLSYEQLTNQVNRFFQVLNVDDQLELIRANETVSDHRRMGTNFGKLSFCKTKTDTANTHSQLMRKIKNPQSSTNSHFSRTFTNFQLSTQNKIEQLKTLANDLPAQNQALFNEISKVDTLIDQTVALIQEEKNKTFLFETQMPPSEKNFKSIETDSGSNKQNLSCQQELQAIKNLLGIDGPEVSDKRLMSVLQKLQELQILTKTACLSEKPQPENKNNKDHYDPKDSCPSPQKNGPSEDDTNKSSISIKFKKKDPNIPSPQKTILTTQKEVPNTQNHRFCRAPQTINSILKNIQVYESYERAFERMDFQKEYETEKNRKKRTLIRRDGMVSLCLLKAQEKNKLLKKQSNKRQSETK